MKIVMGRSGAIPTLSISIASAAACANMPAHAQSESEEEVEILYVGDQYSYEDNLFRLPDSRDLGLTPGFESREDYINRLTLGLGEDFEFGRQVVTVKARAQDVRYSENDYLDHVAGRGEFSWDWLLTSALTGDLDAEYVRSLADFSNNRGTERDLV
jgi:hypothetical protein